MWQLKGAFWIRDVAQLSNCHQQAQHLVLSELLTVMLQIESSSHCY